MKNKILGSIQNLHDQLIERRSDIAEILATILENPETEMSLEDIEAGLESRIIEFKVPAPRDGAPYTLVQYDTLTTRLEPVTPGGSEEYYEAWYEQEDKPEDWDTAVPVVCYRIRSSHGTFTFDKHTGAVLETDLDAEFGPLPVQVDLGSLRPECAEYGEEDVLHVGFFYIDEYGRRQYEPPAPHRDVRCPNCEAPFEAGCACFPVVHRSPRGTIYVDQKEYTKSQFEGVI